MALGAIALLLSPVLLATAVAVGPFDRGPVLYRQEHVGRDGEVFTRCRLGTVVRHAEQQRGLLAAQNGRTGPLFKLTRDPHVLPVGRVLRVSSPDEAPQVLNVLEGTMSLVGPRPALPDEVPPFHERSTPRLRVKPGLAGLW